MSVTGGNSNAYDFMPQSSQSNNLEPIKAEERSSTSTVERKSTGASTEVLKQSPPVARDSSVSINHSVNKLPIVMDPSWYVKNEPTSLKEGLARLINLAKNACKTAVASVQGKLTPESKQHYQDHLAAKALNKIQPGAGDIRYPEAEKNFKEDVKLQLFLKNNEVPQKEKDRVESKAAFRAYLNLGSELQKVIEKDAQELADKGLPDLDNSLYILAFPNEKERLLSIAEKKSSAGSSPAETRPKSSEPEPKLSAASPPLSRLESYLKKISESVDLKFLDEQEEKLDKLVDDELKKIEQTGNIDSVKTKAIGDLKKAVYLRKQELHFAADGAHLEILREINAMGGEAIEPSKNARLEVDAMQQTLLSLVESMDEEIAADKLANKPKMTESERNETFEVFSRVVARENDPDKLSQIFLDVRQEITRLKRQPEVDDVALQLNLVMANVLEEKINKILGYSNESVPTESEVSEFTPSEISKEEMIAEMEEMVSEETSQNTKMTQQYADEFIEKFRLAANNSDDPLDMATKYLEINQKINSLEKEPDVDRVRVDLYKKMAQTLEYRIDFLYKNR